jgi:hypothetical protein
MVSIARNPLFQRDCSKRCDFSVELRKGFLCREERRCWWRWWKGKVPAEPRLHADEQRLVPPPTTSLSAHPSPSPWDTYEWILSAYISLGGYLLPRVGSLFRHRNTMAVLHSTYPSGCCSLFMQMTPTHRCLPKPTSSLVLRCWQRPSSTAPHHYGRVMTDPKVFHLESGLNTSTDSLGSHGGD